MSDLESRIIKLERRSAHLEGNLKGQDTMNRPDISTDSLISKLKLDPDTIKATARASGQSIAEVIAGELGMSIRDFREALKLRARG